MKKNKISTRTMTSLAILIAVILIMAFTPLGYIKTLGLEITFVMIPVIIGAITLGPAAGAFLGGIFGLTSFIQCFGLSAFGAVMLSINPFYTFILCVIPRVLMGWLCGIIFKAISAKTKSFFVYGVASLSGALLNTLFFMSGLIMLFGRTEYIKGLMGAMNPLKFIVAFVGINGLIEAIVCFFVAAIISKAVARYTQNNR